ncbi:MAG TPA: FkbM family methyltransferase [Longimicrobiaceae bacterium]|nr:FkbM family methyltransferase [Longimicrobiaceae bacterium]
MPGIYAFLKRQALHYLPEPLLRPVKARHYARMLRSFTLDQEPDLTVVQHLVGPGDTVVDVGANVGVYTRVLSELVGPTGRVVSVEPVPQTFSLLSHNIRSLGMANVRAVNAAVSDRDATVTMEVPKYDSAGENYYEAHVIPGDETGQARTENRRVQARSLTLDSITDGLDPVTFVKCDVEGHELACIAGSESLIRKDRPAWLIEVSGDPDLSGTGASRLFELLEDESYRPWFFDGRQVVRRRPGDHSTNYFFLAEAHVQRLRARMPGLVR